MEGFKKGDRVRLSGTIPGVGRDVDGRLGTVGSADDVGVEVYVDGESVRSWRFNPPQVEPVSDHDGRALSILAKAAQEILEDHIPVESRDFDTVPQFYMTVGELREIVYKAKEEGAL